MCDMELLAKEVRNLCEAEFDEGASPINIYTNMVATSRTADNYGEISEFSSKVLNVAWAQCVAFEMRRSGIKVQVVGQCLCDECLAVPVE